jgi:hypothetical protein
LETQPGLALPLVIVEPRRGARRAAELLVLDHSGWQVAARELEARFGIAGLVSTATTDLEPGPSVSVPIIPAELYHALVLFAPRGAGLTVPDLDARGFIQFRRRFMMLGQTLDGMRVWDIRRAIQAVEREFKPDRHPLTVRAAGRMAGDVSLAALFEPGARDLALSELPLSFRDGPDYLNVLKVFDLPQLLAWAKATGRISERP